MQGFAKAEKIVLIFTFIGFNYFPLQPLLHIPCVRGGAWDLCVSTAPVTLEVAYRIVNVDNWSLTTPSSVIFDILVSVSQLPPLLYKNNYLHLKF